MEKLLDNPLYVIRLFFNKTFSGLKGCLGCLLLVSIFTPVLAQGNYNLQWDLVPALELPSSIKVYETSSSLPDSLPFYAVYTVVDLSDPNLKLKASYAGDHNPFLRPQEFEGREEEPVFITTNGGFFSATKSVSLVVEDGEVLAPGLQSITVDAGDCAGTTYYPTRGAFGVWENKRMDVSWVYADGNRTDSIFSYPAPNPTLPCNEAGKLPNATFPFEASNWQVKTAMGGIPVLISDGQIVEMDKEMAGSSLNAKHPRTAVGYTPDNKMILLVIDGRQEEHSRGATLEELAQLMYELGAYEALNLDGGGSSAMFADHKMVSNPSDISGARAVASALLVTRQPQLFDTEDQQVFKETGHWVAVKRAGGYGPSASRFLATGQGAGKAVYTLPDIPPAQYELSAWWAQDDKLSTNTPFTIRRPGLADSLITLRLDQTASSTTEVFNYIGTFELGPGDQLIVSNDAADGDYVAVDAVRLRKTAESKAEIIFPDGNESGDYAQGSSVSIPLRLRSPNSGLQLARLRIYKSVNGGEEKAVGSPLSLHDATTKDYTFTYLLEEEAGSMVNLRFELEDKLGCRLSRNYELRSMGFALAFDPERTGSRSESGRDLSFEVKVGAPKNDRLRHLEVYKSVNGGAESLYRKIALSGKRKSFRFNYSVKEAPGEVLRFRFSARTSSRQTAERTYEASIIPAKGNKRIAFISDINSAYGSTDYSSHAKEAIAWIADSSHQVDLVLGSGDFIAGQSASLQKPEIEAMWTAFGRYVYDPIRQADIPFGFSLGNHDANLPLDRQVALDYWKQGANQQDLQIKLLDSIDYPFRYTFTDPTAEIFVIAVDMNTREDQLAWVEEVLQSPEAARAKYVFVSGHFPLFALTKVYNSPGGVQADYQGLFDLLKKYEVDMFFSGHHAAFFPGKKNEVFLLSVGEMGGNGRDYVGTSTQAPSSLSVMDIFEGDPFYGDSLVLTTYDIQNNFKVVKNEELPAAVFAFNGYTLRRDIPVSPKGSGHLSSLNLKEAFISKSGGGEVHVRVLGEEVQLEGSFYGLEGKVLSDAAAMVLCQGLHPDSEEVRNLAIHSEDGRSGSFKGSWKPEDINDFKELLSVGYYSVLIKTSARPAGELRAQLYPPENQGPQAAKISSLKEGELYGVRDLIAYFPISWEAAKDPESNRLTYLYQLAEDPAFEEIIWQQGSGRNTEIKRTEQEWYALTDSLESSVFYHRVLATDGRNIVYGEPKTLHLKRDDRPLTELVEIPAPQFSYEGIFARMGGGGNGYDIAAYDKHKRLWSTSYSTGLFVYNADGNIHKFSSSKMSYKGEYISHIAFKGEKYRLNPAYGVEIAPDGNMILSAGGHLFKLSVETGEAIAHWHGGAGSNPTVDQEGRIFVHKVFPATAAWILKQSETDTSTFEVLSNPQLPEGPAVARTSAFAPEGNNLYLPDASASRKVYKYKSDDGLHFAFDQIIEMAFPTGSNAIFAGPKETLYVVSNRGEYAPDLLFLDFRNNYFWRIPLEDIPVSDLRGFSVTADGKAFFLTGTGSDIYHYKLQEEEGNDKLQP